jgi:hypothetical protein
LPIDQTLLAWFSSRGRWALRASGDALVSAVRSGAPALMPELLVLALAAAGRVPDDGCFAAAAAHNVVVSKNIQD